ncbi:MAG: DUF4157 domain-containing protein [Limisphaerales bacterium]
MTSARAILPVAHAPRAVQRACTCGKPAKDGGECEECKRKRAPAVQRHAAPGAGLAADFAATPAGLPRLPVNDPGDAFEREADAVAEAVVNGGRASATPSSIPTLARREAGPATVSSSFAPPVVHAVLRASGTPLGAAARAELEPRFGHDFSGVRVHTDERAAASARAVNATAYTVGRDIVFDRGAYAPHSAAGRRLLAHELAHVVQQGVSPRAVQRVVRPGLEVEGRATGTGPSGSVSVFFARNDTALDLDGQIAVTLAGGGRDTTKPFDLNGYVSEDEGASAADRKTLADGRIKAVDAELQSVGHTAARNPKPKPDAGDGRLDYRNLRAVEIIPAGARPNTVDCKVTPASAPCSADNETKLADTRTKAQEHLDKARRLMNSGTDAATNDLLDEFFGGAGGGKGSGKAVAATLDGNLQKVRDQMDLAAKPAGHKCGTLCDGACTVAIAYNEDVGKAAKLTLCPTFVSADLRERSRNFIHEVAHATPAIGIAGKTAGTTDFAYRFERRLTRLNPAQALANSDSYSLFVMLVADPAFTRPPRPVDKVLERTGTAAQKDEASEAVALLSDWLKWSEQDTSGVYSTMAESRPPKKAWTNSYYEDAMKLIAPHFGLTAPPALPTDDDRAAVAGIQDRFSQLGRLVRRSDLTVTRDPNAATTQWWSGPGDRVDLGDDFFALATPEARARMLLAALVAKEPSIRSSDWAKFVDLAEQFGARNPIPVTP